MLLPFRKAHPDEPRENFVVSFIRAIGFFLFYYAVRTVIFNAAFIFFTFKYKNAELAEKEYYENANMLSFVSGLLIIALLLLFFIYRRKPINSALYISKPSFSTVILAFFAGLSLNFTTNFIMAFLPEKLLNSYADAASDAQQGSLLWYILAAVVMAPVLEELIFRAMMVTRLSASVGNLPAIIISSAIFGAVHGHIVWSTYAFLLGILLGVIFVRSRSIAVSIATHMGFNLVSLTAYINIESLSKLGTFIFNTVFGALSMLSIPVSVLLLTFFVMKTKKTARKNPIGLDEIYNKGL